MKANIQRIEAEAKRYETSEEQQLYKKLTNFWDTNDDVMQEAVKRTLQRVNEGSFLLQDYPIFFLALQRLQTFGFIDLKKSTTELQDVFDAAISKYEDSQFIDGLDSYYYQYDEISTPEFLALVSRVKTINKQNNQKILTKDFEAIVEDINSSVSLNKYRFIQTCLFGNIGAGHFFELFISYHNCRKRDYWNFFEERYDNKDCFDLDRAFIDSLREKLNEYVTDTSIEASGTRTYCSKILKLLDKKVQQFAEQSE